jgi:hypothetical protein
LVVGPAQKIYELDKEQNAFEHSDQKGHQVHFGAKNGHVLVVLNG